MGVTAEFGNFASYTNTEIEIFKGDTIYLSSDGFPDQFGGPRYKKYTYRRMKDMFATISKEEDLEVQRLMVKHQYETWKKDLPQTDDICLMGMRY